MIPQATKIQINYPLQDKRNQKVDLKISED